MLTELKTFAKLFYTSNMSSSVSVLLIVLYVNIGLYLLDFYHLMRRKSLLETFCILYLPTLVTVAGCMLVTLFLNVPKPGSLRMYKVTRMLSGTRLCEGFLLSVIVYLLLWGFVFLSRRKQTVRQRQNWILACIPDYLECAVILAVSTWRILGKEGFPVSEQATYVYLYCIYFLTCKILLLAVGLIVSLYSVRIRIFRWREPQNPSAFLLRYFLLYQNAVFRNIFPCSFGTTLFLAIPLAHSGELHGKMIGIMLFLLLCSAFVVVAAIRPVIKGISKFRYWSINVKTLKETFCREYFQEEPIYRDHRYTITRSFLIDEQAPATFYYWSALTHMTGWCISKDGKTKILTFSDHSTCTLTEDDGQTANQISDYARKVLARMVLPFKAEPAPQDKIEQGFDTLFRWLLFIVVLAFAFYRLWL